MRAFTVAVGQAQQLQHRGQSAQAVNVFAVGLVDPGVFLGGQKNHFTVFHGVFQGRHGTLTPHEQRGNHAGKYYNVSKR